METVEFKSSSIFPNDKGFEEHKLRTVLESVPNGIIMTDPSGIIRHCNSETERMFGYEKDELLGKKVEELVPHRFRESHPQYRTGFVNKPTKRQMGAGRDLSGIHKNGSEIPVEIGLNHLHTENGVFIIAAIVDITERKRNEKKLREAYAQVQQKNEEMEQFVYTVSHDLKTPLVTSMSFLGFLREDLESQRFDDVKDSLDRLERAHHKMQELINDLLELSRVRRMDLNLEETSLKEVLEGVSEFIGDKIKEKKIKFDIPSNLPTIYADRKRVHQVFENLLTNAIKYASDGNSPEIQVIWQDQPNETWICIKDNGPGIDPQHHEKIFGLFQRLRTDQEGTGVGLTIVARIMQSHHGKVWIRSQPDQGAEFWLAFPKKGVPDA